MLAWSENTLYQDTFQYVFYLSCREVKQLTATSLAELISREWPNSSAPIAEIMFQPERLLFIIDSFEELKCDLDEPESNLHNDWMEKQPVRVLLSSLLRKKMLSESSLLIAATHEYPREVEGRLECPEIKTLMGFTEADRKLYFCCLFQDRNKAMEAFHFVRENDHLFSMCQIPLLCWIVCTSLKQEMEKGRDLALACRRSTSLFASFIFNLFTSSGARRTRQQSQGLLISLCSLAAEGMWTDTSAFSEDDLRRNGIADPDIPMLLGVKVLKRREDESSYTFIHMRVQEFCAAMFYLLKSHSDHPHPAVGCAEALLFNYLKTVKTHWILLGCFVFGLLNEKEQQRLDAFFGFQLSQKIKQQYYQYLKSLAEREDLKRQVDFLALFYCLFEMQNEDFIRQAMHFLQDVNFSIADNSDLVVSAYCLKYCSGLKKLQFSIQNVFQETNGHSCMLANCGLTSDDCQVFSSVLNSSKKLKHLNVSYNYLHEGVCQLCKSLCHPDCALEVLICKTLRRLNLVQNALDHSGVAVLCEALRHPECALEVLG
ncbi:NACHT, LRR and PYD domains-containing protein 4 [Tupaia chinensis]|uniref:NACHT, LRR and PYD domains-containing protein 4 n=1 Tax=Tupaia chinensis TaxID=246437 RepID=L8Y909_TUPCH|nr:NACHT, LRR and PYD domains-containing protein 4 [Tupaia chinensis]